MSPVRSRSPDQKYKENLLSGGRLARQRDKAQAFPQQHVTVLVVSHDIEIVRRWDAGDKSVTLQLTEDAINFRIDVSSPKPMFPCLMCLIPWNVRLRLEHRTFNTY